MKIEEILDCFQSICGSLKKKKELSDVADKRLGVSPGRPVALQNRLTPPDEEDNRESDELSGESLIR